LTYTIGIYLFDDVEVLDFAGPFEVFSTATRVKARQEPQKDKLFEVFTIGYKPGWIKARGGLLVQPVYQCKEHPAIDVLIVPGGVIKTELQHREVIDWIQGIADLSVITASVCTGAFLLCEAGLLDGKSATTHWEDVPLMRSMFPQVNIIAEKRWVEAGRIVTSAGISAGIDMSLYLVSRLAGRELAVRTARQMEYDWAPGR
jgi:transcriptional regulator GlxA family with amidase domain